jgi:hypothetical protein
LSRRLFYFNLVVVIARIYIFLISIVLVSNQSALADLEPANLDAVKATSAYGPGVEAFSEAVADSLLQTESRVKIPGWGRITLDVGIQANQVDSKTLAPFTDSAHSPVSFQTLTGRVTTGLPIGFSLYAGLAQVVTEHLMTGVTIGGSYQLLDFATWVSGDWIPATTLSMSATRTIFGPDEYAFTGQANVGIYNRANVGDFAYVFRGSHTLLLDTSDSYSADFYQSGLTLQLPIGTKTSLHAEIFFPTISAAMSMGYQF